MAVQTRRMTVEEFDRFAALPENADRLLEFIGGKVIEVPSNPYVSQVAARISYWITHYLMQNPLGHVTGEAGGYWVSGERYAPDVAFMSKARQPELARQGYNPLPPDLAVEVLSPSDDEGDMRIKVVNYLRAGTVVWVVNPDKRYVEVYAPDHAPERIAEDGTIRGGDVLPEFTLAVKVIFPDSPDHQENIETE
ncbi:MAG: Uma2 family endonuclease [Anaerolineae bacterium]|nr:Uma2 family endonuclease [Anaerolineae bacterium]